MQSQKLFFHIVKLLTQWCLTRCNSKEKTLFFAFFRHQSIVIIIKFYMNPLKQIRLLFQVSAS